MGQEVAPPAGLLVRTLDGRTEIIAPRPTWHRALAFAGCVALCIGGWFAGYTLTGAVVGFAFPFVAVVAFERRQRPTTHISLTATELTLASGADVPLADIRHVNVEPSYVPGTTTPTFEIRVVVRATDETVGHYDTPEQAAYVRGHIIRSRDACIASPPG